MSDWFFALFNGLTALLSGVGPFFLLLGVLIFIHEAGHFLAARWCGVRVEVFSLGFGPKLFKYKKGDTVYCISAFPLGGYVKMFGDNPLQPPPKEERHQGFLFKKVPQKLAIAFAGPLMNLLFAFFALQFLYFVGVPSFAPVLGDVPENSLAYNKGLRSGDMLVALNGRPAADGEEIDKLIRKSAGRKLSFEALSPSGESKELIFTPKETVNENLLDPAKTIGRIEGFTFASKGTRIGISSWDSPAFQAGLRTFDEIQSLQPQFEKVSGGLFLESAFSAEESSEADALATPPHDKGGQGGVPSENTVSQGGFAAEGPQAVRYWRELDPVLSSFAERGASSVIFTVLRPLDSSKKTAPAGDSASSADPAAGAASAGTLARKAKTKGGAEDGEDAKARLQIVVPLKKPLSLKKSPLKSLGLETPDLYIHKVGRGTPAAAAGLKRGDKIAAAAGRELSGFKEFAQIVQGLQGQSELSLSVLRDGRSEFVSVQPKKMLSEGAAKERIMVGVVSASHIVLPEETLRRFGFWNSGIEAGAQTLFLLKSITVSLGRLIKGSVSVRHLAGPVGIGRAAHRSFQAGRLSFIFMMALISLSLFYMNLLPVPLLDGGHILFFAVEGILGRPLSVKKLILAQRAGLAAVLSFFALAFVNDIYNWLTAW